MTKCVVLIYDHGETLDSYDIQLNSKTKEDTAEQIAKMLDNLNSAYTYVAKGRYDDDWIIYAVSYPHERSHVRILPYPDEFSANRV